ncbi:hypothetical protein F3Y22_tig00006097pilonHSYRG00004 [Hibiscus syriacus]|uniref:NB-ARC domain-containing protein n=1 Tax=Hibiscus syriacus TaxID=106335 RepID=A0A6A3CDH7_HIBSY|nr:hypothetical protein F3Y22_tig00006097pilonHSYRG00004 [Hibiscus syriacus]
MVKLIPKKKVAESCLSVAWEKTRSLGRNSAEADHPIKGGEARNLRMSHEELAKMLYKVQQEKKCLIVIDDIWTMRHGSLCALQQDIAYNPHKKVGLDDELIGFLHEPECLNEEQSWSYSNRKHFQGKTNQWTRYGEFREGNDGKMCRSTTGHYCLGLLATKKHLMSGIWCTEISDLLKTNGSAREAASLKILEWEVFIGKKMTCSKNSFPQLKTLLLRDGFRWDEFVTTLRELEIRWMSRAFKTSVEEDGRFLQSPTVPSIAFVN